MSKSRLIGEYPVIGIRPTIDGRRGKIKVRELLEANYEHGESGGETHRRKCVLLERRTRESDYRGYYDRESSRGCGMRR